VGLLCAALCGVLVIWKQGVSAGRKTGLPMAPFLAIGGVVAILVGPELVHWYTQTQSLTGQFNRAISASGR